MLNRIIDYCAENLLRKVEELDVYLVRRENSVRDAGRGQCLAVVRRRFVEGVGLCVRSLLLRCVHAVILDGSGAALVPSDAELAQRAALLQTAVDVG